MGSDVTVARRRYDGAISALLALLLVGQVMAVAVRHSRHTVSRTLPLKTTVTVVDPGRAKPKPVSRKRAAKHRAGTLPIPAQPVAPEAQGNHAGSAGIVSRHWSLTPRLRAMVPTSTVLVHLLHPTHGYASATATKPNQMIPARWYGYYSVLPVINTGNFRLQVRLPRRPNESTAWVDADKVRFSRTPYAILIDLKFRRLFWFDAGQLMGSYPVGIGAANDPTPTGSYFVAFRSPPPDPSYGPFVLATSDHSTTFSSFDGQNDAIIAIHGPIDAAGAIGSSGAAISHGCIRMLDPDLAHLSGIPNGTPVIITY
jgi:lipoprotein-anchoring transpeptidase ErfK/SrfK